MQLKYVYNSMSDFKCDSSVNGIYSLKCLVWSLLASTWFALVYNLIYPNLACHLLVTMEMSSNQPLALWWCQWRHFGDLESIWRCPCYRLFLSIMSTEGTYTNGGIIAHQSPNDGVHRQLHTNVQSAALWPLLLKLSQLVRLVQLRQLHYTKCHRELARAHHLDIMDGALTNNIPTDEIHHQLYNDVYCSALL